MLTFIPVAAVPKSGLLRHSTFSQNSSKGPFCTPRHCNITRRAAVAPTPPRAQAVSGNDRFQREEQRTAFHRDTVNDTPADMNPPLTPGFAQTIVTHDGRRLIYDYVPGDITPTILFLPGYYFSRWRQAKANALEIFAKRKGQAIVVEEYLGTGEEGDFVKDGTLSQWIDDACALVDCINGPVLLVGAGIGGWIMLHVAMRLPKRVIGMVGISPSVDFTRDLIGPSLTPEQNITLEKDGVVNIQWGHSSYPISKRLLEDAEQWCVLEGGTDSLDVSCPVRLVQGLNDEEIPADRTLKLVDVLSSDDCIVSFIKSGDHFLQTEADMKTMWDAICDVTDNHFEYDLRSPASG